MLPSVGLVPVPFFVMVYCKPDGVFTAFAFNEAKLAAFSALTVPNLASNSFLFAASSSACFFLFAKAISAKAFLAASFFTSWTLSFSSFLLKYSANIFSALNFLASLPFLMIVIELITLEACSVS